MAKISISGIAPNQQIKSEHILRVINALRGDTNDIEIEVSGSISASQYIGDGSLLTNLPIPTGSSNQITISSLPFTLVKNTTIPNISSSYLENGDIIKGFEPSGSYIEAQYLGGDSTDFFNVNVYKIFSGI